MLKATGSGIVALKLVLPDGITKKCRLHDVIYVPQLSYNLLSVSKMTEVGKKVSFYDSRCQIFDKNKRVVASYQERKSLLSELQSVQQLSSYQCGWRRRPAIE